MRFDRPFDGRPVYVPGADLEEMFVHLVEEPPVHDSEIPEECSLCGPLLTEAIIADFADEVEEFTRVGSPIQWPGVEPGPITDESEAS